MSSESVLEDNDVIEIESMSIDQLAGSVVLILGAVGSLLLVVWQSRCGIHCRLGCSDNCYLCDCKREPPPVDIETPNENNENVDVIEDEPIVPPNDNRND